MKGEYSAAISASMVVLLIGLHFGWPSHAVPKLQAPDSPTQLSNSDGSWLISIAFLVGIFAFPTASYLFDRIGRKKTLLLTAVPYTIGWTILAFLNHSKTLIFFGQSCLGFADSIGLTTIAFYLSEISRSNIRGGMSSLFSVMYNIGALLSACIGPFIPFHMFPLIPLGIIPIFVISLSRSPETPHFYVMHNNYNAALDSLRQLRGDNYDIKAELVNVKLAVTEGVKVSLKEVILNPSNRKAFMIVVMLVTLEQFSGITTILFYCQKLFSKGSHIFSPEVSAIIFTVTFLFGSGLSSVSVDKLGRRPLALISCGGCCVFLILQGIYFYFSSYLSEYTWLGLVLIVPYVIFASVGLVNLPMVMMGELFHSQFKGVGSIAFGMYISLAVVLATKFFQFTSDEIANWFPFFCFAGNCLIGIVLVYFFMPETKNRTLAEIQMDLCGVRREKVSSII